MTTRSEQIIFGNGDGEERFDGKRVRSILGRAAVEQHRLETKLDESYTLEELEDMAAEAGISQEALRAAIDESPSLLAPLWRRFPRRWSLLTRQLVFWTATIAVLLALMIAFPIVAKVMFWATIIVLVMMALGVSPF